jgi:hypothetical protein
MIGRVLETFQGRNKIKHEGGSKVMKEDVREQKELNYCSPQDEQSVTNGRREQRILNTTQRLVVELYASS